MKLNQTQRYSLLAFLFKTFPDLDVNSVIYDFDNFCDGEIIEWQIIYQFGMAGKIWNNCDRIYISGHSGHELGGFRTQAYIREQKEIARLNTDIEICIGPLSTD